MFGSQHYVPILKFKQGEYQALFRLSNSQKDALTPLLEIPPIGFDFESQRNRETLDDHLGDLGRRLRAKWQARTCFVDLRHLRSALTADGRHCVTYVFDSLRAEGCKAIPVVSLSSDATFLTAVASTIAHDQRGVCVRFYANDYDRGDVGGAITQLLQNIGVTISNADLVLDFEARTFIPISLLAASAQAAIADIPNLNRWRSFTLAGTSYPQSIAAITAPYALLPRREWEWYQAVLGLLGSSTRIPTFGDYGVAHPDLVELDMRLIKPFAKLRYTTPDSWHIGRGKPVRTHGFGQFQQLCIDVVNRSYFDGPRFSAGDEYIAGCAAGTSPTGNLTTWVWVSTNRHLAKVASDLARFHGT